MFRAFQFPYFYIEIGVQLTECSLEMYCSNEEK